MTVSRFDTELAKSCIDTFMSYQKKNGLLPDVIWVNGSIEDDYGKPPVMPWAACIVFEADRDMDFLRRNYEKFIKLEWFLTKERSDGILFYYSSRTDPQKDDYLHPRWESGWDNSPRWDVYPIVDLYPVDLNCFMVLFYRSMAKMAEYLSEDSSLWKKKEKSLAGTVEAMLYDETQKAYVDRNRRTGTFSMVLSPASFMPLFVGKAVSLTSFFSVAYCAVFLPVCVLIYTVVPPKAKKYLLLFASYLFFWLISGKLVVYLILTTFSIHYFGIWIDRTRKNMLTAVASADAESKKIIKNKFVVRLRTILCISIVVHIGILLIIKYSAFFSINFNTLLSLLNAGYELQIPKYIMPIGISFFTLQALSYIIDVYNGITTADDNILRLALFISFFPQIIEGPICRYNQTAQQLWNVQQIRYENLTFGIQRILFGLLKKIVIADRLNPFVNAVFSDHSEFGGGVIALAAVCYTVQLYMDFSGTMDAVIGSAQIFGIDMPENFRRPFFSRSISEFWKRWHITLGTWFRDYLFYPISTSRTMKKLTSVSRKKIGNHYGPLLAGSIALLCVWFCNGLWHGAAWHFIFFGIYHFALILTENLISPVVTSLNKKLHIKTECRIYRSFQIIRTALLVVIGELFFRAVSLSAGFSMFGKIFTDFSFRAADGKSWTQFGTDPLDFLIVIFTLAVVFAVSCLNEKNISVRLTLAKQHIAVRWATLYAMIIFIVIFGAYGFGYSAVDPLYAQF